jgi:hypothetical protein
MHADRRELIERQPSAAGLPLWQSLCPGLVQTSSTRCT